MKHVIFTTLLTLAITPSAFAGSFLEPSIGYRTEVIKLTDKLNNQSEVKTNTPTYGLKLGYRSAAGIDINLAGDYSSGNADRTPLAEKVNFSHKMAAVQMGINALGAMKIYLGYAFLNELNIEKGAFNSDLILKGPAYQAGVQFRLFSAVSIGAHYNLNQFDQVSGSSYLLGEKIDTYFNKLDSQDYSFNLSLTF